MAGIRELKQRLGSVRSAGKITTAMQMVASAKLKKAARAAENFVPYQKMLQTILDDFLSSNQEYDTPFIRKRSVKQVTLVAFSSNSGFCGAFNTIIIDSLRREMKKYSGTDIRLITVGKKVSVAVKNMKFKGKTEEWARLIVAPHYGDARELADHLMDLYLRRQTDKVVLIYFHYKNPMVHELTIRDYLPLEFEKMKKKQESYLHLYILEPKAPELIGRLLPKVLRSDIFAVLLDSFSSEQGARTVAMQLASENASKLSDELSLALNRQRQQMITTEILELSAAGEESTDF
ncbi:MAG: ATP synthase F1 subunit gamma [Bacteroidales bacterium]